MSTTATHVSIEGYLSYEAPPGFRDELIEGEIILPPEPKPLHSYPKRRAVVVHEQSDLIAEYRDGEGLPLPVELSNLTIEVSKIFVF